MLQEQSDPGLYSLPRPVCPKLSIITVTYLKSLECLKKWSSYSLIVSILSLVLPETKMKKF